MADRQSVVELIFEGVDKTQAATQSVIAGTKSLSSNIETATQPIADFTVGALKLEAGILAAGAALTAFAVNAAGDFQSATADLAKVLSDTDSIEEYTDLAIEMSERYGVASTDVLNSISNYKQAGFTAEEAGKLTKSGLDLVIAGNVEAARSSELLVSAIKGFGAEAGDSAQIVDLLNAVSNEYAATTGQLLEGFADLSPVAAAAGLSLEETIGILTPGIEVFQSGSEVANALKTSLLRLTDDSKPVQEALAALGVAQRDANGELRSARDIYFDLAVALQNVDDNQRLYIAGQLVGVNQAAKFLAVTDGLSKTLRIAGDDFEYLGSAAKEVAIQLSTAEKAGDRAKVALTNLFIGLGIPILDEFTGVADAITEIFRVIGRKAAEGGGGISELVAFIESQFQGLQSTLETVAANLPDALDQADFSGFMNGISAITGAIGNLFDGIDLTTAEGLADAITLLGRAFESLSEFSGGVISSFKPLFDQLTRIGGEAAKLGPEFFDAAGKMAGFATQINSLTGGVNSLVPALTSLAGIIGINQAAGLVGSLGAAATALSGSTGLLALLGKAGLVGAAGAAGVAVGTAANNIAELTTGTSLSTRLVDWFTDVDDAAADLEETVDLAALALQKPVNTVGIVDALEGVQSAATGIDFDGAADSVAEFEDYLSRVGSSVDDQAASLNGVSAIYDEVTGKVIGYTDGLSDAGRITESFSQSAGGAAAAARDLNKALDEISIEEKVALIEGNTQIAVAGIEAFRDTTVAAFESVGTSITSTGDLLGNLFQLFDSENLSFTEQFQLEDQIKKENERREQSFELQKKLTDAQAKYFNAQAKALGRGDALITVNGDGLEPHLEAMMWEVFRAVQVRVNQDGLQMLLGATT